MGFSLSQHLHLDWLSLVFFGRTEQPDFTIVAPRGIAYGLALIAIAISLLIAAAATLPQSSHLRFWGLVRVFLCIAIWWCAIEISTNPSITLGAPIRDMQWPMIGWNLMLRASDICIVSLGDTSAQQRAPRWIVPSSQKDRFPGCEPLPPRDHAKETKDATTPRVSDGRASEKPLPVTEWYVVPHTPSLWSTRRLLWAWDQISVLRPGTSLILPWEQRSLEWSHAALLGDGRSKGSTRPTFGNPESLWYLLFQVTLLVAVVGPALDAIATVPQSLTGTGADFYYALPLSKQMLLAFCYGFLVPFPSSVVESLLFPLLLRLKLVPRTALLSNFDYPLLSAGPVEFWGRRWHSLIRRVVWRNAFLVPGSRTSAWISRLAAFGVSGTLHSWILVKWLRPVPPTKIHAIIAGLFLPGPMLLFVGQGAACAVEVLVMGAPRNGDRKSRADKWIRTIWLWVTILIMGRWYVAAIISLGLNTVEGQAGFVPAAWGLRDKFIASKTVA
ncbi:unnamed protein product [Parajaminaea phylloscopi]